MRSTESRLGEAPGTSEDAAAPRRLTVRLAPGRSIRSERPGDCPVLICPSGRVPLNESAAQILALCDGTRTREEIVDHVLRLPRDEHLALDVREFLDVARERGWIVETAPGMKD